MRHALAIDIGGTKLATAAIDDEGRVLAARKTPVDKKRTFDQITAEAAACLAEAGIAWDRIEAAGAIVPGIFHNGSAWAPNLWGDCDVAIAEELAARLPVPLHIDCDRAGYVLGEAWLGAARGLRDVVFLGVGTGIGAGILAGGRVLQGAAGIAGAVGWFALTPEFQPEHAHVGCWEAEAAGPAVARLAGLPSAEAVVQAAQSGGAAARAVLDRAAIFLAMGIANLISTLNPEMVVLGGGLMQSGILLDPIRRLVPQWAQPRAARQCRIELTRLGERAGLYGAACLAFNP